MQYLYEFDVYKEETALVSAYDVANVRLGGDLREREQVRSKRSSCYVLPPLWLGRVFQDSCYVWSMSSG